MVWFNICLLIFISQSLFDTLLRPAIENLNVTSIQFTLDEDEQERWKTDVKPKVENCWRSETGCKLIWRDLNKDVSFILSGAESKQIRALLSFWGEPFYGANDARCVSV